MPTLVLVGEDDPARNAAQLTHTKIEGSQYVVIPGAGHLSNLDQPEEFNKHITEFLKKVESGIKV
jgi:pimeloyl-ACP methyl ester carboxylesterase